MLTYLSTFEDYFGPFRLFSYVTFRCMLACAFGLGLSFLIAPRVLRALKALKMSQTLRNAKEVGKIADLHQLKKDTPTMGGLMLYLAFVPTVLLCCRLDNRYIWLCLLVYTVLTGLGFWDDYLKVSKKNSKGLDSKWKWLVEAGLAFVVLLLLLGSDLRIDAILHLSVPFLKDPIYYDLPYALLFIFFLLVMAGASNAINLTDGVDGLAIGCTVTVALAYGVIAYVTGHAIMAHYLNLVFLPGIEEIAVLCFALVGTSLAFLWYNCHPAQVFMGDTGSLALGGLVGTIAFLTNQAVLLVLIGGVFVIEAVSVILQVGSFKMRRKRIFKMAPIHHHFELKGWHENKVVIRFWILSLLFALAGLSTLKIR